MTVTITATGERARTALDELLERVDQRVDTLCQRGDALTVEEFIGGAVMIVGAAWLRARARRETGAAGMTAARHAEISKK